jgi:YesN/AraC family two-component response regulator
VAEVLKDTERKVLQSGMKGYLTKPINLVELYKTIENIFMNQHKESNNINKSDYSKVLDTEEGIARLVNIKMFTKN